MSAFSKEIQNTNNTCNVCKIQLGIFNPNLIKKASVCEITSSDTYEGNQPKINGLFDPRMGVIDYGRVCATCNNTIELCPGHFGHIELGTPVYHIHFLSMVIKLLQCVCFRCSTLLIDKSNEDIIKNILELKGQARFTYINSIARKTKRCQYNNGCNCIQPSSYSKEVGDKEKVLKVIADFKNREAFQSADIKNRHLITAEHCYQIFKRITDNDCELLGFSSKYSRPEWMICTVLPVPPPSVRPSVRQDNNQRSEDDLTFALGHIIKNNNTLKQRLKMDAVKASVEPLISLIQYYIATYINNDIPGIPLHVQRSGRPLKSIEQRLKAKEGRIRGNLMGKRVDYSARTVISADPNIDIDQWGVPMVIAMNLTFPEKVTKYNIEKLYKIVRNGPHNYPGANTIVKQKTNCYGNPFPCSISLKHVDLNSVVLDYGDIVNRHLQDDDIGFFNRQPSLHRMSMMAHRIKILPGNTFRLNVSVTTPYNADFDGDEMNMHAPQSYQTSVELRDLTSVPTQIINPAKSAPIITVIQDALCGAYLLTYKQQLINKKDLFNLMMRNKNFTGKLDKETVNNNGNQYWTGQQVYSHIIPDISSKLKNMNPINLDINTDFTIINGKVQKDNIIDKGILGSKGLIQQIHNTCGVEKCCEFINQTQQLTTKWITQHSFSVSFEDAILEEEIRKEIKIVIDKNIKEANKLIVKAQQGIYKRELSPAVMLSSLESEVTSLANKATEDSKAIIKKNISDKNGFFIEAQSGAKGKFINIQQIMGTVGQQTIWGSRVENGFTDRTLPFFPKNDIGVLAKGYCVNSYMTGLNPVEFFFHAMGGRTGQVDTAVKTAASGYISRRLMKALEDVKIAYDNTVRNAAGTLVQYTYGDDGFDATKLEKIPVLIIRHNNLEMKEMFKFDDDTSFNELMNKETYNDFTKNDYKNILENEFNELMNRRDRIRNECFPNIDVIGGVTMLTPINAMRIVKASLHKFNIDVLTVPDIHPIFIIEKVNELCEHLKSFIKEDSSLFLLITLIKYTLNSKRCIIKYNMNKLVFEYIIETFRTRIMSAFVQPGEMVGPVGAQSLGEPSTQLTLNTFHQAGVAANSVVVVSGVPRLTEIINVSKTMNTPSMKVYLKDEYLKNKNKIKTIRGNLQFTQLKDIILESQIIYEKNKKNIDDEDIQFIKSYNEFNKLFNIDEHDEECLSPWILRIIFDKESIMNRNIYMSDIQETILRNCNSDDDIQCTFSDDNSTDLVLRIKIRHDDDENYITFMKEFEKHIRKLTLRGVSGLSKIGTEEINIVEYDSTGNVNEKKIDILTTAGTNLIDMMAEDYVDCVKTTSNNIIEIYEIFGIEAVRAKIIEEMSSVLAGEGVTFRHVEILADIMTSKGTIMQIMRHGINRSEDLGPIAKMSFEEVTDIIVKSSIFGEEDDMKGVSSNIMLGQFCKDVGTNAFNVVLDEDKMMKNNEEIFKNNSNGNLDKELDEQLTNDPLLTSVTDESFDFDYSLENVNSHKLVRSKLSIPNSKIITKNKNITVEATKIEKVDNSKLSGKLDDIDDEFEDESEDEFEDESEDEFEDESEDEFEDESEDEAKSDEEKSEKDDNESSNEEEIVLEDDEQEDEQEDEQDDQQEDEQEDEQDDQQEDEQEEEQDELESDEDEFEDDSEEED